MGAAPCFAISASQGLWEGYLAAGCALLQEHHLLSGNDQTAREKRADLPPAPSEPAGLRLRLAGTVLETSGSTYAILGGD